MSGVLIAVLSLPDEAIFQVHLPVSKVKNNKFSVCRTLLKYNM